MRTGLTPWYLDMYGVRRLEELGFPVFHGPVKEAYCVWGYVAWVDAEDATEYSRVIRVIGEIERDT